MDWYPLWNSLRIASISCAIVFFLGILAAYYVARLPRAIKGILDVIFTLPMVLPPTVCGYFLLILLGPRRPLGIFLARFGLQFAMTWYGGIVASAMVAFPLMYRTARGAFESFDQNLAYSGQTLGLSNPYIFWRIRMPACRQGILAGTVLVGISAWYYQPLLQAGEEQLAPDSLLFRLSFSADVRVYGRDSAFGIYPAQADVPGCRGSDEWRENHRCRPEIRLFFADRI